MATIKVPDFKSLFRPGILSVNPYSPGRPIEEVQRELGLADIIKLASNEDPQGPHQGVVNAITKAAQDINRYPDGSCYLLTQKLAEHLNVDPSTILLGNGSNELLNMIVRGLISPGENMVFARPSFVVYDLAAAVHFECGRAIPLDKNDKHDLVAMAKAVDAKTKLLMICNPNNPTGTYNSQQEVEALLQSIPSRVIVVLDEAYFEYAFADDYPNGISLLQKYPNLVVTRTFSKIYALAGLRVGYAVGHPELITQLQKTREPFNVNTLAQSAAITALSLPHVVKERCMRNKQQGIWLQEQLIRLGFEVVPSQANFLFVRHKMPAGLMCDKLLKMGVIIRPMNSFGLGDGALRITIGLAHENQKCVLALESILV
ncbi:MAG: histidinol-phosphate transaminase [Magnetococcales bacterium]|nr:histidinol-phosphate transaminase [Magnetococcales bacterium]